jgi:hypothetical protein
MKGFPFPFLSVYFMLNATIRLALSAASIAFVGFTFSIMTSQVILDLVSGNTDTIGDHLIDLMMFYVAFMLWGVLVALIVLAPSLGMFLMIVAVDLIPAYILMGFGRYLDWVIRRRLEPAI